MKYITTLFFIFLSVLCFSQHFFDTLNYNKNQRAYSFRFQNSSLQLLNFDTIHNGSPSGVAIQIFNNSKDSIVIKTYKPQDQMIMWLPKDKTIKTIAPDSAYTLIALYHHNRPGPFHNSIRIYYSQNNTPKQLDIRTKGFAINVNGDLKYNNPEQKTTDYKPTLSKNQTASFEKENVLVLENKKTDKDSALLQPRIASFPTGEEGLKRYIDSNIDQNLVDEINIDRRVFIQCVVNIDGSLSQIKIIFSVHHKLTTELIRILKNSPPWICAVCCNTFNSFDEEETGPTDCSYCRTRLTIPYEIITTINRD